MKETAGRCQGTTNQLQHRKRRGRPQKDKRPAELEDEKLIDVQPAPKQPAVIDSTITENSNSKPTIASSNSEHFLKNSASLDLNPSPEPTPTPETTSLPVLKPIPPLICYTRCMIWGTYTVEELRMMLAGYAYHRVSECI
ncbi:hypothetical protein GcM1_087002 [Golovinomyces cichoracearum]|uniref:Uncharacterized protein n=1 Tax=Golovinomyces cichoracearum TaxID=62708 RepID=A0A420JC78_9PEZI|nr:hypothetical protein GcM1_087002 [Golovinomyces cichoracearum]